MTEELLIKLLNKGEGELLDYKRIPYFSTSSQNSKNDKDGDFIKDILAFSNCVRNESCYILIGVETINGRGVVVGVNENDYLDEAILQQKLKNKINPIPKLIIYPFYYDNKRIEIIELPIMPYSSPPVPTITIGNKIRSGQIYIRRGSSNEEASYDEIIRIKSWLNEIPKQLQFKVEQEDFSSKQYFDVALHESFTAHNITVGGVSPNSKIKYFIKSVFSRTSSTGKTAFYKNLLYDSNHARIFSNTMNWNGISCLIDEDEIWGSVGKSEFKFLLISTRITDKTNVEKEYKFIVSEHDGQVFQSILDLIKKLNDVETHNALTVFSKMEKEIDNLNKKIISLESNLTNSDNQSDKFLLEQNLRKKGKVKIVEDEFFYYENVATITGKLGRNVFGHPPIIGKLEAHNSHHVYYYIDLIKPINVLNSNSIIEEGDINRSHFNLKRIQLTPNTIEMNDLKLFLNKTVIVSGRFTGGFNAWHQTPVLLIIDEIAEV